MSAVIKHIRAHKTNYKKEGQLIIVKHKRGQENEFMRFLMKEFPGGNFQSSKEQAIVELDFPKDIWLTVMTDIEREERLPKAAELCNLYGLSVLIKKDNFEASGAPWEEDKKLLEELLLGKGIPIFVVDIDKK